MSMDNFFDAALITAACAAGWLTLREIARFLGPSRRRPVVTCVVRKVWDSNDNGEV